MEILAPAGSWESVAAAVANGADAVYLGQQKFNARQNAENFDYEELKRAVDYCHLYGVKVYQTLNTLVFDEELEDLQETLRIACEVCVDALIVQDFGVLKLVRETCPDMRVHASTQMTVHTPRGAKLMETLGVKRIVLARELSLKEIEEIVRSTKLEIEVFVHGALCMSVSGQCYMSAMIGGRSGNKGSCAGSCRLPFGVNDAQDHDLSLKDLCCADSCKKLAAIGVTSLKIEGRMKRPEYVAAAVRAYRDLANGKPAELDELRAVFSRSGFTQGYLTGKLDGDMFGIRSKEDVTAATDQVLTSLQETYRKEKTAYGVSLRFVLEAGKRAVLTMADNAGGIAEVTGGVPEEAISLPLTVQAAQESLEKLGGTPFFAVKFDAQIGEGLMLPKAKLNDLRRRAVAELSRLKTMRQPVAFHKAEVDLTAWKKSNTPKLRARFAQCGQIPFEQMDAFEAVYIPVEQAARYANVLLPFQDKIILEPDRVLFGEEERSMERLCSLKNRGFDKLAASNPAHVQMAKDLGVQAYGTSFLNCTNSLSCIQYKELGISDLVLSTELTLGQLKHLAPKGIRRGAVAYGALPLMVVRNCPVKRHIPCKECRGKQNLTDRLGNHFPVICNARRYSEVLNCKVLQLADKQKDFAGMDFLVLYFTTESAQECATVLEQYRNGEKPEGDFTRGLYYRGIN